MGKFALAVKVDVQNLFGAEGDRAEDRGVCGFCHGISCTT